MRNAIAGSWIYMIVIIFMVVLIAYVAITINYANAFEQNEYMIKAIEESEGFNNTSRARITQILKNKNATVQHGCPKDDEKYQYIGILDGVPDKRKKINKYDYCIGRQTVNVGGVDKQFYKIIVYFSFSIPVLGDLYAFQVAGETGGLVYVYDDTF